MSETSRSRFNPLDTVIVAALLVGLLGFGLSRAGLAGVDQKRTGFVTARFDLFIRGGIADPSMFKVGDRTFITIRNQPYAAIPIVGVKINSRKVTLWTPQGARAVDDLAEPYSKDVVLTLEDRAEQTDDGIVLGGNKIKVGVPIDIEGARYRLRGSIVDLRVSEVSAR